MAVRVPLASYLAEVIRASERAANIARLCRSDRELFQLLVGEKTGDERNKLSRVDFKTLADVLIQETVRHYLEKKFPVLGAHVMGEESTEFTNALGESIAIRVCSSEKETEDLLVKVLDGDQSAAHLLASAVHEELPLPQLPSDMQDVHLNVSELGVWIDPIDCTGEYVRGELSTMAGVPVSGLVCVTVLIGTFHQLSGEPVVGVINQPFAGGQEGRVLWGAVCEGRQFSNVSRRQRGQRAQVAVSESEPHNVVDSLRAGGWEVLMPAGVGYKMLCVIDGCVDCYVSTHSGTYRWDTCAPHAILKALGGNVQVLKERKSLIYNCPDDPAITSGLRWRNIGGFVAYMNPEIAVTLMKVLNSTQ